MNSEDENEDKSEIEEKTEDIEAEIQAPSEEENDEPLTIKRKKKVPKKKSTLKMSNFEGQVLQIIIFVQYRSGR